MKKVLRSVQSYKTDFNEPYKIVIDLAIEELPSNKVKARLIPRMELENDGQLNYIYYQTFKDLSKEVTKAEIAQFKSILSLDPALDMYDTVKTVELETAKTIIEADQVFFVNNQFLKASDFEIVTLNLG